MHRFSDFATQNSENLEGEKREFRDLLGTEIQIHAARFLASRVSPGKECVQIQFRENDDAPLCVMFTSSVVVMKQLREHSDKLPFMATIKQHGKYYTLT